MHHALSPIGRGDRPFRLLSGYQPLRWPCDAETESPEHTTSQPITRDAKTEAYFDEQLHDYSVERLAFAAESIRRIAGPDASLVDVGCGTGNTLKYLCETTGVRDVVGVDVSGKALETVRERVGCPVYHGSVLDDDLRDRIGRRFDVAVMAALLHHLIGPTRAASKRQAALAVHRGLDLLAPGGHLVVLEPIFYPRVAMDAIFYIKKAMTSVTGRRIEILGEWNNIGAPVVSYLTNEELIPMMGADGRAEVVERNIEPEDLGRLGAVLSRTTTTLVARKLD